MDRGRSLAGDSPWLWYKYSHRNPIQATSVKSLNSELEGDTHKINFQDLGQADSSTPLEQYIFIPEQVPHIFVYKRNPYSFKVCLLLLESNKLYKDTVF